MVFDYLVQRDRNFIQTAKNDRHRLFQHNMMLLAFTTGVIYSRFSGERRQAQNERGAPDTFLIFFGVADNITRKEGSIAIEMKK